MSSPSATFREFADRVRAVADIVEVVGQYVELRRAGANLKGLCPFHQEKTPSFHVHPGKQIYKCFGCGKSGDVVGFVREIERADFRQALEILAGKYSLEIPRFQSKGVEDEQLRLRQGLSETLEESALYYQKRLAHPAHGERARQYLDKRGISPEMREKFRLGVAGEDWAGLVTHLQEKGQTARCLLESGVARERKDGKGYNDYLRGRLIFPIANARGETIGFGGRAFSNEEQPKYLNTAETELFHKGSELYGLAHARDSMTRKEQPAVLVEGYMDVIACHQAGVTSAVASMGTSLTPEQARLIHRYTKQVVFLYDGDEAGIKAIQRGLDVLVSAGLSVRVGILPAGEDPDSYARANGDEALRLVVSGAVPFFDFLLQQASRTYDLTTPEGKVHALEIFEPVLAAIPEELVYDGYVGRLALAMGHEQDALRRYLRKQVRPARRHLERAETPAAPRAEEEEGAEDAGTVLAGMGAATPVEMGLLHILIEHGEVRDLVRQRLDPACIEHPLVRYWVSRILELGSDVYDVWPVLIGLCESPEHELFLQSVVFKSEEPMEDFYSVAEFLISRIIINHQRGRGKRLNLLVQEMFQKADRDGAMKVIEEQMSGLQTRIQEMERARKNTCIRVKHNDHRTKTVQTT